MGNELFQCCTKWLDELSFPANLNDTTIVLILKKENADTLKDLRPIALCNVLYKVIAKVLANRLKVVLQDVISENQSAFVPGKNISDNVLVAFELLHFMRQRKRGVEGNVALKLDVSKAYDRGKWDILENQMKRMGFASKWIDWILLCVQTVSYSVSFNDSLIGPITPMRGLRQGDLLSPYLFLLCVEEISRLLRKATDNNRVTGCKIHVSAPSVTHLLFVNDSFLFCKSTIEEVSYMKALFQTYERLSGQAINFQKSGIYFSVNVRTDKQMKIKELL